jgi:hypothetical protein
MSLRFHASGWKIEITWRGLTLAPLTPSESSARYLEKRRLAVAFRKRKATV